MTNPEMTTKPDDLLNKTVEQLRAGGATVELYSSDDAVLREEIPRNNDPDGTKSSERAWARIGEVTRPADSESEQGRQYFMFRKLFTRPDDPENGAVKLIEAVEIEKLRTERARAAGEAGIAATQLGDAPVAGIEPFVPLTQEESDQRRREAGMFTPDEIRAMQASSEAGPDTAAPEPYAHLFEAEDDDEAVDVQRAAAPTTGSTGARERARTQADAKYNAVRDAGGTHEQAEAAAARVWRNNGF